jgi:acetyl-CoA C-acetyltransferase
MHAIAETVQRARTAPGTVGFVGANGGMLSKYSVGVYSTAPAAWRPDDSSALQAEVDAWAAPAQAERADGWATIETYTVTHGRAGDRTGVVVGRLTGDGRRFLARTDDGDDEVLGLLSTGEPIGQRLFARSTEGGNRVTCGEVHPA